MLFGIDNSVYQTFILLATALITLFIYWRKNLTSLRNASKLVALQIKDIEKNIDHLKIECITPTGIINEQQMYNSVIIFEQNLWYTYRHQLFNYLSTNDYALISKFYENASMIKMFQEDVKNFMLSSLKNRGKARSNILLLCTLFNENLGELNNLVNEKTKLYDSVVSTSYIPLHYGQYIPTYLSAFQPISGTTAYSSLIKLSKKMFLLL